VVLKDDDLDLFELLDEYRAMRSHDIADFLGRSIKKMDERLRKLYDHGYIDRIQDPLNYYPGSGSTPHIIVNDNKAAKALELYRNIPFKNWRQLNRNLRQYPDTDEKRVRRIFHLSHQLLIPAAMAAFVRTCRARHYGLIPTHDIWLDCPLETQQDDRPFAWMTSVVHQGQLDAAPVEPDKTFGIHYPQLPEGRNRAFFFLEMDRGTESLYKQDLSQSSIYRKLLAFIATNNEKIHTERFAFRSFRALFIVPDDKRIAAIQRMMRERELSFKPGYLASLFLFQTTHGLQRDADILDGWVNAENKPVRLHVSL
jgi:DNA-binding Lrp family transcriptional regulator